jgi:hypothetical protein
VILCDECGSSFGDVQECTLTGCGDVQERQADGMCVRGDVQECTLTGCGDVQERQADGMRVRGDVQEG